jgi:ribonuclease HIII
MIKNNYKKNIIESNKLNILFVIQKKQLRITAFRNGTCLLQGKVEKVREYVFLIKKIIGFSEDYEKKETKIYDKKDNSESICLNYRNEDTIGSDEVGTGDVFGPIVVCSVFLSQENISFCDKIGVKDSKKILNNKIIKIFNDFKTKKIPYIVKILDPQEYNILKKKKNNLNKIKALLHNKAIIELLDLLKIKENKVILDQFSSSQNYFNYLNQEPKVYKKIQFMKRAEEKYLSVALASIIARYFFLKEIEKIGQKINIVLKLGASYLVEKQIQKIIELYPKENVDILNKIAKCDFKNVRKYIEK